MGNIPGGGLSRSASLVREPLGTGKSVAEVINLMLTMLELNHQTLPADDFRIVAWLRLSFSAASR